MSQRIPLYEQVAQDLITQIDSGTFRPGEKIPSVRKVSQQRQISITTVLQAFHLMEDRGIIEAHPQSGYYVRAPVVHPVAEPIDTTPDNLPIEVSITELAMRVLHDSQNPSLVHFGTANPDAALLPTRRINQLLASIARKGDIQHNIWGMPEGHEELRIQVAQHSYTYGCSLTPDDILITNGCVEAINLALRAVCQPGDLVAIESPTYFSLLVILETLGLRALEIPTHPQTGVSLDALRFALDNHSVKCCLFVLNFNNPLGSCMPDENKQELVEMLAEREIPLIDDDIYGELHFHGQRPRASKAFDRKGLVLHCSSFSKDISPSLRVGWIAPGKFMKRVEQLKMATNIGTPVLPQLVMARLIAAGGYDHHLRRIRRAYAQKVNAMAQGIMDSFPDGTRLWCPSGGFMLWIQLPDTVDSLVLYQKAIKAGISLVPGYICSPTQKYRKFIRLNAAFYSENTERALIQLGQLVYRMC